MAKISVLNTDITVLNYNDHDYISLTDMASANATDIPSSFWVRGKRFTIPVLKWSNLTTLESRLVCRVLS